MYKGHYKNRNMNRLSFIASVHPIGFKNLALEIKIRNSSLASQMPSQSELMSFGGMSSLLLIEWPGRVKGSETAVDRSM